MVCTKELDAEVLTGIVNTIVDAARDVHRGLGPGMLETAYETCMTFELMDRGLHVERQRPLPVVYRKIRLDYGYRLDLLVEDAVVVEIKAVDALLKIHEDQLLSYLRISRCTRGLLINFSAKDLDDGIIEVVDKMP